MLACMDNNNNNTAMRSQGGDDSETPIRWPLG